MKKLLIVLLCLTLVGCAATYTNYVKKTGRFGYSDYRLSDDIFSVSFSGNGYCTEEQVEKYVLRRASEVTIENGFTHFVILEKADNSRQFAYQTSTGTATAYGHGNSATAYGSGYGFAVPFKLPALSVKIKCFKNEPPEAGVEAIDAKKFLQYNFPEEPKKS